MTKGGGHPRESSHRDPHTQASRRPRPLRPLQLPLWQPRSLVCTPPTPHPAPSALPPSSALLTRRSGDITARTSAERELGGDPPEDAPSHAEAERSDG